MEISNHKISCESTKIGTWKLKAGEISASGKTDVVRSVGDVMANILKKVELYNNDIVTDTNRFKNFKFLMTGKTMQLYHDEINKTLIFKGNNFIHGSLDNFEGYKVVECADINDDTILFTNDLKILTA